MNNMQVRRSTIRSASYDHVDIYSILTNVLRHTKLLGRSLEILHPSSDEAPLHERSPEEHSLRAYQPAIRVRGKSKCNVEGSCGVSRNYAAGSVHDAPAGWFMKAWSLEAPAEVAAPDISWIQVVYTGTISETGGSKVKKNSGLSEPSMSQ